MRGEYTELACNFCDKGRTQCWHIPSISVIRRRPIAAFSNTKKRVTSPDIWLIKSGCNVCNKSQEEVEKELRKKNII
jgi:hypothetical protein